jgi:hypothetical protein
MDFALDLTNPLILFIIYAAGMFAVSEVAQRVIPAVVDLLKWLPIKGGLPDGLAPLVSALLHIGVFVAAYWWGSDQVDAYLEDIDSILKTVTTILPTVINWFNSVQQAPLWREKFKKTGLYFSYSEREKGPQG